MLKLNISAHFWALYILKMGTRQYDNKYNSM